MKKIFKGVLGAGATWLGITTLFAFLKVTAMPARLPLEQQLLVSFLTVGLVVGIIIVAVALFFGGVLLITNAFMD